MRNIKVTQETESPMCPYDTKENVTVIKPLRWLAAINMMDIFPYPAKEEEVNAIWKKTLKKSISTSDENLSIL